MPNIKILYDTRGRFLREMQAMTAKATAEDRDLSDEEHARFKVLQDDMNKVDLAINKERAKLDAERAAAGGVVFDPDHPERHELLTPRERRPALGGSYAQLFGSAQGHTDGFSSMEEFFRVMNSGLADGRFRAVQFEGVPSTGGFAVPEEFAMQMLDQSLEGEIVRPRATVEPMALDSKRVAGFDVSDSSAGALYGGFTAQWLQEGAALSLKDAKLRMIELNAKKLGLLGQSSNELIADGGNFEDLLAQAMVKAMSWHLDYAFLRGTGAGQPLGVLNDPALIVQTKEGGQAAATINYQNVVKMFSRLHAALYQDSIWVANPTTIPQLLQLSFTVGTGGSLVPVLNSDNGKFTLLTRPIIFTEKLPALGAQGDIVLASFSQYVIGLRKEVSIEKSNAPGFTTDLATYRGIIRVDGQGKWAKAYAPRNGSTQSWCVTLEPR